MSPFRIWQLVRHVPTGRVGNYDGYCRCCCKPDEVSVFFGGGKPEAVRPEDLVEVEE